MDGKYGCLTCAFASTSNECSFLHSCIGCAFDKGSEVNGSFKLDIRYALDARYALGSKYAVNVSCVDGGPVDKNMLDGGGYRHVLFDEVSDANHGPGANIAGFCG